MTNSFVFVAGNPVDGFTFTGPTQPDNSILEDAHSGMDWWYAELIPADQTYIWPDPSGGWIDAWNGWYPTKSAALDSASRSAAERRSRLLTRGERLIDEDEMARRLAVAGLSRPEEEK